MSHIQKISGDPATIAEIVLRKSRNAVIIFEFSNEDGSDYPVSDDFVLRVKQNNKSEDNLIQLEIDDGLEIIDGDIHATFTEDNSNVDQFKCVYELINLTTGKTWIASKIYFNTGEPIEGTTSLVSSTINLGDNIIECSIVLARPMTGNEILDALTDEDIAQLYLLLLPYINGEVIPDPGDRIGNLYSQLIPYINGELTP